MPLNLACEHGSERIVELLLKNGARILPDAEGLYPQHLVARSQANQRLLLLLKEYGADLDQIDKLYGWTPLVHAASEGNVPCLQALLKAGVDPTIPDEKNLPAMYYAALEGHLSCMKLLSPYHTEQSTRPARLSMDPAQPSLLGPQVPSAGPEAMSLDLDLDPIPELSLPPPIMRLYGHNYLDTKTVLQVFFDDFVFFQDSKYPAARLTISSKISEVIPKNIILPFQEDTRLVSFQVDDLESLTLDFDVFPTYGAKVIAKTVALPAIFAQPSSSGACCLALFDARLRAIGQVTFRYHVIRPFRGKPLELTSFETYWKATKPDDQFPSTIVTGSSLSGDFVRLYVQYTSDGVPVLWPSWTITCGVVDVPVCRLTAAQFEAVTEENRARIAGGWSAPPEDIAEIHNVLAKAGLRLSDAIKLLPDGVNINLHILYPDPEPECRKETLKETARVVAPTDANSSLRPVPDVNVFVDMVLSIVFDHVRRQRGQGAGGNRSVVFSSYSARMCTALNWKQPNFPVFLCNDLGRTEMSTEATDGGSWESIQLESGRRSTSIKEVIRVAQNNNFIGLICCSQLLVGRQSPSLGRETNRSRTWCRTSSRLSRRMASRWSWISRVRVCLDGRRRAQGWRTRFRDCQRAWLGF